MSEEKNVLASTFLTFRLGEEEYGFDVARVREVLDVTTVTKVPQTPDYLRGVINLRGSVVPVVDLRLKFGMESLDSLTGACIIVLEIGIDGEQTVVGALADEVLEVLEIEDDAIEPPPRIGTRIRTDLIRGMGRQEDKFLILLEIDRILTDEDIDFAREVAEEPAAA